MKQPAIFMIRAIKTLQVPIRWRVTFISFMLALSCLLHPLIISSMQTKAAQPPAQAISTYEQDTLSIASDSERQPPNPAAQVNRDSADSSVTFSAAPAVQPDSSVTSSAAPAVQPDSSATSSAAPAIQPDSSVTSSAAPAIPPDSSTTSSVVPAIEPDISAPSTVQPAPSVDAPAVRVKPAPPVRIPVLNYHSITVDPGNPAAISPEKFAAQMQYLFHNGYTTLSLKQFTDIMEYTVGSPDKPVLLTFDDGYADNYEHAVPLLKELGFKATLFMSPGMVEDGYYLNWDQVKEMHEAGWDIQPHGMSHPHLNRLSAEKQSYEIFTAKRQIEEKLGTTADVFCYPYGERNQTTLRLLHEYNFRYAFTIEQGMTTPEQEPLRLRRIFVNGEETMPRWKSRFEK